MEVLHFIYNDQEIDFTPSDNNNVMVNATQMAKIFDKDVRFFLKTDHVNAFIEAMIMTPYGYNKSKITREEIVTTNKKGGTWMHRALALKFAAWLDPEFEVWVFMTIDNILYQEYQMIKQATFDKLRAEKELEAKREELIRNNPEFEEFLEMEAKLNKADKNRIKAFKDASIQLKIKFATMYN